MKSFAGQQFYLYTLSQFLDHATNLLKREIDPAAIQEIKQDEVQLRKAATELKETPRRRLRTSLQRQRDLLRAKLRAIDTDIEGLSGIGTDEAFLRIRLLLGQRRDLNSEYETTIRNLRTLRRGEGELSFDTSGSLGNMREWFAAERSPLEKYTAQSEAARRQSLAAALSAIEGLRTSKDSDDEEGEPDE